MRDERLLNYYERELTFLRQLGAEFADEYSAVASRLRMETSRAEDPHVERLLQGFAFLAARIHLKVDDDFPEISRSLLEVLYPEQLRPVPSMSVVQFDLDPDQGMLSTGWPLPRDSRLVTPPTRSGARYRFRTCYDTVIWPVEVTDAGWHSPHEIDLPTATDAAAVLRVDLAPMADLSFDELELDRLRFFLDGEPSLVASLYELLDNNCTRVVAWNPSAGPAAEEVWLPSSELEPVGFGADEGMLPETPRSFLPHRLLREYFTFPRKFHFFDLGGLERVRSAGLGGSMQLLFFISSFELPDRHARLQEGVNERTMRVGCAPVVNLFSSESRPIGLTERKPEYLVSVQGETEVFSVERVYAVASGTTRRVRFQPLYGFRHGEGDSEGGVYWNARRQPRRWGDRSLSDVYLSFVDLRGDTTWPDYHSVTARVLCSNGDLPNELPFGTADSDFQLEEESAPLRAIRALTTPTKSVRPAHSGRDLWRLVSQLSLNLLSLVDNGVDAFREVLRLYDPAGAADRQLEGITKLRSEPMRAPVYGEHGLSFARGRRVRLEFDEELFTGRGVYLLSSVVERFLALYASLNSFTRLEARSKQRSDPVGVWPPRSGTRPLV